MGLIQMFCIDLKVMCMERPRHPELCVKRADSDVKRFPRYRFVKLQDNELWRGIGENSKRVKLRWRRTIFFSELRVINRVPPLQFYTLGIFPYPGEWFVVLQL